MAAKRRAYNARVKVWIVGKRCAVFPNEAATQCHHSRGRTSALLMDERHWIAVSASGHDWIHNHIAEARKMGLIAEAGDWGRQ